MNTNYNKNFNRNVRSEEINNKTKEEDNQTSEKDMKPKVKTATVNTSKLYLRKTPHKEDGNEILILEFDETLIIQEYSDEWAHVSTEGGTEGFVMREFIEEE